MAICSASLSESLQCYQANKIAINKTVDFLWNNRGLFVSNGVDYGLYCERPIKVHGSMHIWNKRHIFRAYYPVSNNWAEQSQFQRNKEQSLI